jgi:CubicO group peptidase (beta-lactamase class C family)
MNPLNRAVNLSIILICLSTLAAAQTELAAFDNYVEASRKQWNVPGISIVVVQDGKVVFEKGYGVRELGRNDPVTNETLFGSMSTTKAMTVACLAMLVDEGKLNWDDKVIKYLPDFRVADPYVTNELRVRDLLTHSGGLGNADFLWVWTPEMPFAEIMHRMQYATPAYSLRSSFIYQNIMYGVAGQVLEKVSGMPWREFVKQRLFAPLDMKNSFGDLASSRSYANRSLPHYEIKNKIEVIEETPADAIAPAGAAWSTAEDIGKWVAFMLGDGTWNGRVLIKPATMNEIFKPQVIVPAGQFYPTIAITKPHWMTYGLAWFQHDYRGEKVDFHTGSLAGRTAIIGLMRDKKLGVYIFGNLDHAEVRHALMYKVFDVFGFNDTNGRDWSTDLKKLYDDQEAQAKQRQDTARARRAQNTNPSLPLASYAGRYSDPFYGTVDVAVVDGKLRATFAQDIVATLAHYQYDTFSGTWNKAWRGESLFSFQLAPSSPDVVSLSVGGATLRRVQPRPGQ